MKNLISILVTALILTVGIQQVRSQQITVYGFGSAYNTHTKTGYISAIMSGTINSKVYFDASQNQISNQFKAKLKKITGEKVGYVNQSQGFCYKRINAPFHSNEKTKFIPKCTKELMVKQRKLLIEKYKKNNFKVKLIPASEFQYVQSKR